MKQVFNCLTAAFLISCSPVSNESESKDKIVIDSTETVNSIGYKSSDSIPDLLLYKKELSSLGVNILIPKNWEITHDNKLINVRMNCQNNTKFCANYVLHTIPKKRDIPVKNYALLFIDQLSNSAETKDLFLISNKETIINGLPVRVIDYMFTANDIHLGGTTALFQRDSDILSINFTAINEPSRSYIAYRKLYGKIIASVNYN